MDTSKQKLPLEADRERKQVLKERLKQLTECEEVVSAETMRAVGDVAKEVEVADDNAPSSDEFDDDLEAEYEDINELLDLPNDTYSLTAITPELPACVKYGVRSGLTHINMSKFSPLSRGYQAGAAAIAAFAATTIYKSRCWNEAVIDQIVEDGDTFYCQSYKHITTDDRRSLTILDLKRTLQVQKKLNVTVSIEDASYAGKFRSEDPKELHLVKALELFFKKHHAGILSSPVLDMAIWKEQKYYSMFDGQPRKENCEPSNDEEGVGAKLFLVKDLIGVLFVILEKSKVENEPFVIYGIEISGAEPVFLINDTEDPEKFVGEPQRRPSGYVVHEKFRAVVQGSFHLTHPVIPEELRGRGHLVVALAALVYSRLVSANKWTTALIDLIFNQANIYLIDLVRVLEKKLDDADFELKLDDLMGDIVLGVYSAKCKVRVNAVPGYGQKKGKLVLDSGIREFFETNLTGILEVKRLFYAIWKENDTYYLLDPFACDDEGFRVQSLELPEGTVRTFRDAACVTMNSSVNQMVETILENTGSKEKDPFMIHGVKVLYIKTGTVPGGPLERVIYREKGTNRRPQAPSSPSIIAAANKKPVIDKRPRMRETDDKLIDISVQYPEMMTNADEYTMKEDEPTTFVVEPERNKQDEEDEEDVEDEEELEDDFIKKEYDPEDDAIKEEYDMEEEEFPAKERQSEIETAMEPIVKVVKGYRKINANRLVLHGTKNCLDEEYKERSRGRQGLIAALAAISYRMLKNPRLWRNIDIDQIVDLSNKAYENIIEWIRQGRPSMKEVAEEMAGEEEEEEEKEEEEEEAEDEELEEERGKKASSVPSHLDLSMLPTRLRLGQNDVFYTTKMKIVEGEANPLANLAEALECYFARYSELILENKKLMYGIWREDDKFFVFNPYGADEEGWRVRNQPACFVVTDSLNELVDLLYGVIEYNDPAFILHFVGLESIQPGKYVSSEPVQVPTEEDVEKFRTKFLPITDEDLLALEKEVLPDNLTEESLAEAVSQEIGGEDDEDEEEDEDEEDEEVEDEEDEGRFALEEMEKPLIDPLLPVKEMDQPDAPQRLNLLLLTANVMILEAEEKEEEVHEQVILEKLKYNHPPPYVMPPKMTLRILLEAKRARRSVHSLVSRFSIDSRLEVKKKIGLPPIFIAARVAVITPGKEPKDDPKPSKLIKLSEKKFLYSRMLPICLMPLRAINDRYIHAEDDSESQEEKNLRENDVEFIERPEIPIGLRILPELIPLGIVIKTPTRQRKAPTCPEEKKRKCVLTAADVGDPLLNKILCNTEDTLLELLFPGFKTKDEGDENQGTDLSKNEQKEKTQRTTQKRQEVTSDLEDAPPEPVGFTVTDENVGIIRGNMCLKNRSTFEAHHLKSCYYAAILCILGKVKTDVDHFRGTILDEFVVASEKIYQYTGKLRHKFARWFYGIDILGTISNVVMKQAFYADPEAYPDTDELLLILNKFLGKHRSGVLIFGSCSFAFWVSDERYYLFDPYGCDEKGHASEDGYACLLEFCDLNAMLERIRENAGESASKPFRLHTVCIAHMEMKSRRKRRRRRKRRCIKKKKKEEEDIVVIDEAAEADEMTQPLVPEVSLIELAEWVTAEPKFNPVHDMTIPGFSPIKYYNASMLDVIVLENEITAPCLAPFKKKSELDEYGEEVKIRKKIQERRFKDHSAVATPIDLCLMAWSLIHDPNLWSVRTVRALFEASTDYAFDSILASEDSTVPDMVDGLLAEFEIGNYSFHAVRAPLHYGTLYAEEGWNLAMSLEKIFDSPVYTGAILVCENSHIGVMKINGNYFAWWTVRRTKNLRIITSEDFEEFLRIIVKEIQQPEGTQFVMRVITVTYARKLDPDCSDIRGLHEPMLPTGSLPQIHKQKPAAYDLKTIFKPVVPKDQKPVFVLGTVALKNRDSVKEPRVKRCYFVAVLAVMVKRDIVQSPMPGMIDKVIEVAESLYKEFHECKYHVEHILRNVTVMNRIFDFRDCALPLVTITIDPRTGKDDYYPQLQKHLKKFLEVHTSGIVHFTNCCYGFWYSRSTNSYYYLDPYGCDEKGRKATDGKACLCVFSTVTQMTRHMSMNRFEDTTGFFLHQLHVESINVPPYQQFQEDPMWVYLDYHWNVNHAPDNVKSSKNRTSARKRRRRRNEEPEDVSTGMKLAWNNYAVEVSNLIYSVWGTIGSYDPRFGERAGKNKVAICVAVLAMQYLSHPSRWGPAILDSAVICGDCYYTESLKSATRKCARHENRYNLQRLFRIFPNVWTIDFLMSICGVLYGDRTKPTLTEALKIAFKETSNILLECNSISLAVMYAEDGYYVADPCWVGPPLFGKDRGALYVLRCRNINSLVYAVTKMLNTNQRLEFRVTPIAISFDKEDFEFKDAKAISARKKILTEPVRSSPGIVDDYPRILPASPTVPEGGCYMLYRQHLTMGICDGANLENPGLPSMAPSLARDNETSTAVSTTWHLNFGNVRPLKRVSPVFDPRAIEHVSEECLGTKDLSFRAAQPAEISIDEIVQACDDYPKVIDFMREGGEPVVHRAGYDGFGALSKPLECLPPRRFITDEGRVEFDKWTGDMLDETYKTYRHRLAQQESGLEDETVGEGAEE